MAGRLALAAICFPLSSCAPSDPPPVTAQREILPDGGVRMTYPMLPVVEDTVIPDFRIGSLLAGGPDTFGEVRGIDVAPNGAVYVLDAQTRELRVFGRDGAYQETLTGPGQGPGEISGANGFSLAPDGSIWINDYAARGLTHLSAEGRELARYPAMVPGFGFIWAGSVDDRGVVWERWSHPIDEPSFDITATGPVEANSRVYYKSFDPRTNAYDSVFIGLARAYSFRAAHPGGQTVLRVPFSPLHLAAADHAGNFWTAVSNAYVLTRTDAQGDTSLVLTVGIPAPPVTQEDIDQWREQTASAFENVPLSVREEIEALAPPTKGVLDRLVIDDLGRLWVARVVGPDEAALYDVFDADGTYQGSVRLFRRMYAALPPVIRDGRVYALVLGDFDEQYVVAGPVPAFAARR